ncbi:PspA-associated protein PspAB [Streptomyces sp. HUAS TT7]|uniref:PspA-associated protein PspAB n=1 Tax=Streptomyces sp. HUAS TT7 TaxID=3447507 RepID=UPI003F6561A8
MGFLDILLGRTRPAAPDLDRLFGLPSAAVTLQAAAEFTPTGRGSVCFTTVEGPAFARIRQDMTDLLNADTERDPSSIEFSRDSYGYSWLLSRRGPDDLASLVGDLHAVNTALEGSGFGPQLLCSLVGFGNAEGRTLALVYLYKRGSFYPFAPLPGEKRDNALELRIRAVVADDLHIESDLSRWFPVWGAPGL